MASLLRRGEMRLSLMSGASSSQESATRVKGRMQSVVHMMSVNSEQNTRLTSHASGKRIIKNVKHYFGL